MSVIKNEILWRVYGLCVILMVVAAVILTRVAKIGLIETERWQAAGDTMYFKVVDIEADRGNVLSSDGSMLATSIPSFEVAFDPCAQALDSITFYSNIDSLAFCLATFIDAKYTPGGWRDYLINARKTKNQYVPIKKNVSYDEMQLMRKFPIFRLGQFKGGLISHQSYRRDRPFGLLAQRTIGYIRKDIQPIGIEGAYNAVLAGEVGKQIAVRRSSGMLIPVEDLAKIEPKSGKDVLTTIDVNIQDVTENALYRAMKEHDAGYGVAIVMEVATGAIKSIANLGKLNGDYQETYNYGIGTAIEPGSTIKLASAMALLEEGFLKLSDTVHIHGGSYKFFNETLKDAKFHGKDTISFKEVFAMSSNVGVARMVQRFFGDSHKEERYIKRLKDFQLHLPTGIEIDGEASPYLKEANSVTDNWSGTTLPWMSMGYEMKMTPLQILNFYNTVANDGRMMKPYLVSEVQEYGNTIEVFRPTVIKRKIASKNTILKAKELLEEVVLTGTASGYKSPYYAFAGKTGTTQLNYKKFGSNREIGGYQASFVGYFPAENPVYSAIIVISDPKNGNIYGADVALPVFREIADRMFSTRFELHEPVNTGKKKNIYAAKELPGYEAGKQEEMAMLARLFDLPLYEEDYKAEWAVTKPGEDSLKFVSKSISNETVPNVVGMGLRDAIFILESRGLKVQTSGVGHVKQQSIVPGTKAKGQMVRIRLG